MKLSRLILSLRIFLLGETDLTLWCRSWCTFCLWWHLCPFSCYVLNIFIIKLSHLLFISHIFVGLSMCCIDIKYIFPSWWNDWIDYIECWCWFPYLKIEMPGFDGNPVVSSNDKERCFSYKLCRFILIIIQYDSRFE